MSQTFPMELQELQTSMKKKYIKSVSPKGDVLNDNGVDVDHLGRVVYAEALAQQIERINTPVTIGVFARWGTGKSFLLKHVQSILMQNQKKQRIINKNDSRSSTSTIIFLSLLAIGLLGAAITTFVLNTLQIIGIIALFLLFLLLNACFAKDECNTYSRKKSWYRFSKVIAYALFTKLPIRENESPNISSTFPTRYTLVQEKNTDSSFNRGSLKEYNAKEKKRARRFIYVNYNAWQYAGCDTLWAGIVTALAQKIEQEFGVYTTRVFRSLSLKLIERPLFKRHFNVKYLLIKFKKNANSCCSLQDIKRSFEERNIPVGKELTEWIKGKDFEVEIADKENCWVVEFVDMTKAEEVYEELQRYEDLEVSILETPDRSLETKKTCGKTGRFYKHFQSYKRLGYILSLFGMTLVIFTSAGLFTNAIIQDSQTNSSKLETNQSQLTTIAEEILILIPAGVTLFWSILKFLFALYNSHRSQVIKALQGAKKDLANELGFMEKIKKEVQSMTDLINTVELSHNIEYKVIISIDDLDRVPLSKVKSVLEAVNILLSDRDSPFICLIAIDSRIANDCFIASEENRDVPPTVNGHEYLKKIINLPFCLPEMDDNAKSCYINGLIDEADVTNKSYNQVTLRTRPSDKHKISTSGTYSKPAESTDATVISEQETGTVSIEFSQFLFDCRHHMYHNKKLIKQMSGNPRNLKRIFNVISITASLISSMQERENRCFIKKCREIDSNNENRNESKKFAEKVLYWIVLTDQWPFRMSYILVVIEDADQRSDGKRRNQALDDSMSLFEIYKTYVFGKERKVMESHDRLLCLDYDPDVLYNLLLSCKHFLTKGEAKKLHKYTTNLDSNLMKSISLTRDKIDQSTMATDDDDDSVDEEKDELDGNKEHVNNQGSLQEAIDKNVPESSNAPPISWIHQSSVKTVNIERKVLSAGEVLSK